MVYHLLAACLKDRRAATSIEYGIIAGGIAVVCVAAIYAFGDSLQVLFSSLSSASNSVSTKI